MRRFLHVALASSVAVLALGAACARGGAEQGESTPVPEAGAPAEASPLVEGGGETDGGSDAGPVFVAPSDARDRIGVYAWGFDSTNWPGSPDRLNWAAGKIATLGARTIRVYLGPRDVYQVLGGLAPDAADGGAFDLAAAAGTPAYRALFTDPRFDTFLLTTYSASDDAGDWANGYTPAEAQAERTAISELGTFLLSTFPDKTFVLLDWEGDNAIAPFASDPTAWDGYAAWTNARSAGVAAARAAALSSTAHLYTGVEMNLVRNPATGAPCDTGANRCIASVVLPQVDVDYYAYSSWQSTGAGGTPSAVAARLLADLDSLMGWAKKRDPTVTPARFIVGEFGAPRDEADLGECAATLRTTAVVAATTSFGASWGIFWQILDNALPVPQNAPLTGFGIYKASGAPSLMAQLFQTLYQTQVPTAPTAPSCPTINQGGVVDGVTYSASDIDASATISIFGSGFSDAGDTVHVTQSTATWTIANGSPFFYASPGQINATLPGVFGGQNALVYVTDGNGIDTNGQVVVIVP